MEILAGSVFKKKKKKKSYKGVRYKFISLFRSLFLLPSSLKHKVKLSFVLLPQSLAGGILFGMDEKSLWYLKHITACGGTVSC